MKSTRFGLSTAAGVLALATVVADPADAAVGDRYFTFAASGVCAVNNPDFDASVRRRATEFRNAGSETVVVSCGLVTDDYPTLGSLAQVAVHVTNHRAATAAIGCTLTGGTSQEIQVSNKKTQSVAAGATAAIFWNSTHYGTSRQHASISCSLPAGWSVNELTVVYTEDIGL